MRARTVGRQPQGHSILAEGEAVGRFTSLPSISRCIEVKFVGDAGTRGQS